MGGALTIEFDRIRGTAADTFVVFTSAGTGRAEVKNPADARTLMGLGTAATTSSGDYATAAQGSTADSALQPGDIASGTITPRADDIDFSGGSDGDVFTVQADGSFAPETPAGIGGSTGATDNAVLAADGTGGSTVQARSISIHDLYTASPNNTVNAVVLAALAGTTNADFHVAPKGTGAFVLGPAADGTATGGNKRGANAVDLQTVRSAANQVASGDRSIAIGAECRASALRSVAIGYASIATTSQSVAIGGGCTASGVNTAVAIGAGCSSAGGEGAVAMGYACTTSGAAWGSSAIGVFCTASGGKGSAARGSNSLADRACIWAHASGEFATKGDAQSVLVELKGTTTSATPLVLSIYSSDRLTIPSGKVCSYRVRVIGTKSDGSAVARYLREVIIKNVGGTTTLVNSETIGTDYEDDASTDLAITADDTNDALAITVTGIAAETWRWLAVVEGGEIAYGT